MFAGDAWLTLAALALVSFVAGAAKGLTGFGGALVMAPLFSFLVPPQQASLLIVLVHCITSLQGARDWAPKVRWRVVVPFAVVAVGSARLIAGWTAGADAQSMRRVIGACVLIATVPHLRGWRWQHGGRWPATLGAGLLSGAMTAFGGLGGPAAVHYFSGLARGASLRANLLGYFALLFGGVTLLLGFSRIIHWSALGMTAWLVPAFAAGVGLGERHGQRLGPVAFDRLVGGLLVASGLLALLA
jgi:uncharacterized membrane protein YfcA